MQQNNYDQLLQEHDRRLANLRHDIEAWAHARDAWMDTWWLTWSHCQGLRRPSCASQMLCSESRSLINEIWDEDGSWSQICENHGFRFEFQDHITIVFFPSDDNIAAAVQRRAELEWLTSMVTPDISAVHGEVYKWFAENPELTSRLPWRAFEELVASAFAGQGFKTKLGSGRSDQGVDIRLLDHPVLGDILTVVQVKSGKRPVRLEAVQALAAASTVEGSEHAILVSSSRFLPGAENWAKAWKHCTNRSLTLAGPRDVAAWCVASWERSWLPNNVLRNPVPTGAGSDVGKILVARNGWSLIVYRFGLVIRQTPGAVLLRLLRTG